MHANAADGSFAAVATVEHSRVPVIEMISKPPMASSEKPAVGRIAVNWSVLVVGTEICAVPAPTAVVGARTIAVEVCLTEIERQRRPIWVDDHLTVGR